MRLMLRLFGFPVLELSADESAEPWYGGTAAGIFELAEPESYDVEDKGSFGFGVT